MVMVDTVYWLITETGLLLKPVGLGQMRAPTWRCAVFIA